MKKALIVILVLFGISSVWGTPVKEPLYMKHQKRMVRIEGCSVGLMYYVRDTKVTPDVRKYCERVVDDAVFMYEFLNTKSIVPVEQNFERNDIKINFDKIFKK